MAASVEGSGLGNKNDENNKNPWEVLRKHRNFIALFIIVGFIAIFGAIYVLKWFVETSGIGGQGTWTIDQFSIGSIVTWCILFVFNEIVLIGIPAAVILGGLAIWGWKNLTQKEKDQFGGGKPTKKAAGSGCLSTVTLIIFLIIIFLQGEWNTALGAMPYSDLVYTYLVACIISVAPFILAALIWFFYKLMK